MCQDPLEKFFGNQRQRGGTNENPTVKEFCKNIQALRVINGTMCKEETAKEVKAANAPLPKRGCK